MTSMSKDLPITSYIVLGLLSFGEERSGYQIRKAGESLKHFYWNPAQSQIYRELRRLEANQLVTSHHVPQMGRPDKQLYRITGRGTAVFRDWITHQTLPPTIRKHPLLLKLFFGHAVERDVIQRLLREFIEDMQQNLAQLAIVEEFLADDTENEYAAMIVDWNMHYCRSELTIAQKLLRQMEAKE